MKSLLLIVITGVVMTTLTIPTWAGLLLIPMNDAQSDHLKAYGVVLPSGL